MKIAFILYPDVIISNKSNGIRSQAETWAELLRHEGVYVDLVNNWGNYNWKEYDAIHLFGAGRWLFSFVKRLSELVIGCLSQYLFYINHFITLLIWLQR